MNEKFIQQGGHQMTLRDLLETNTNDLTRLYIYQSEEAYDELDPDIETNSLDSLFQEELRWTVNSWFVDVNFSLHVLVNA